MSPHVKKSPHREGRQVLRTERASAADLSAIHALLESSGLPSSDLKAVQPEFLLIRDGEKIIAAGALQAFGSVALLRSVVVVVGERGRGLGSRLVSELERRAVKLNIEQLVLLTETARDFFQQRGYRVVERRATPAEVQASAQFRSLCPSSATCMTKSLAPSP